MPVQGSSWEVCFAIITTNSFDRKGKQEGERGGPSLRPRCPGDRLRLSEFVFSYYGTYVYFIQTDILSATHAE